MKRLDRLRLSVFKGVLASTEWLATPLKKLVPRRKVTPLDWRIGVSVIIPERESPDLLAQALRSVEAAAERVREPVECIVVANGCPPEMYEELQREHPNARFLFSEEPLGFNAAIRRGVRAARYGAVYLMNNDMTLEPDALAEILEWRRPNVFAISSQIFFTDRTKRREETGWSDFRIAQGQIEMFQVDPEDPTLVRGHLYASGGASLFHRDVLLRLTRDDAYAPFYYEDAEWGVRAWRLGYEVLFCPKSIVWHRHRATVSRFYAPAEIERVVARNSIQFQLRNFPDSAPRQVLVDRITKADFRTRRELTRFSNIAGVARARLRDALAPCADAPVQWARYKFYPAPAESHGAAVAERHRVVVVSPYAIFPPAHGGAVRVSRLIRELSRQHEVVLLSDEPFVYGASAVRYFEGLSAVHLVGGRLDRQDQGRRMRRIESHSHATLANELGRIISSYDPDVVQVEYMELGGLLTRGKRDKPWVLCLHDVLLSAKGQTEEDRFELDLINRHDAVIACSPEDAALLDRHAFAQSGGAGLDPAGLHAAGLHAAVAIVPNGAALDPRPYVSSAGKRMVLFMGPFRYGPNLEGIRRFLDRVYPELRRRVPGVELWLAGGHGAPQIAAEYDTFSKPGVRVLDYVEDPRPLLDRSAITINPQNEIRGSSIKLIESLAAGRVCVSTVEGARGFRDEGFASLVSVARIDDMLEPLVFLLSNEAARVELEQPRLELIRRHDWASSAARLSDVYQRCLEIRRAS